MTAKKPAPPCRGKKRIVLVDDHPMMRQGLAQLINQQADLVVCCEAGNASDAGKLVEASEPDLAIVDLSLEDSSGLELIKNLQVNHPNVQFLVMSMHDETVYAERLLRAGARGYVMKQAGGETVLAAIRRVLSGQVYLSEKMSAKLLDSLTARRPRGSHSPIAILSDREFEIFRLVGEGKTTRQIAQQLHLSPKTVDAHRGHIKEKLDLKNVTALLRQAVRWVESQDIEMRG
jgi:DNA-binding NarL/FixJ family response regulator